MPPPYDPPAESGKPRPQRFSDEELRAIPRLRLEGDWFATDVDGRIALFIGGDAGPLPEAAAIGATENALRAMDAATEARAKALRAGEAYRGASYRPAEPIFDLPRTIDGALHDSPYQGYPHLMFGNDGLREEVSDVETNDALVRGDGFALIFPSLGPLLHAQVHKLRLCRGCRTLDPVDDPRLRAPELVTTNGLYAYLHPIEGELHTEHDYFRVCSPSVPADEADLEPLVLSMASRVIMPFRFEDTTTVSVIQIRSLGPISSRPPRR